MEEKTPDKVAHEASTVESARQTKLVNICTDDGTSDGVSSLLDRKPSCSNYSDCPTSSPDREKESGRKCDSRIKIRYEKSTVTHVPNSLDYKHQDCTADRCDSRVKTDSNLDERSFNFSRTEVELHVLNFNDNCQQGDASDTNDRQHVKPVLNITKDKTNVTNKKCKEAVPIGTLVEETLSGGVDTPTSCSRLEGQTIATNYPNQDLKHISDKLKARDSNSQDKEQSRFNHLLEFKNENKCTQQYPDNEKGHKENIIDLSNKLDVTSNKYDINELITYSNANKRSDLNHKFCPDNGLLQSVGVVGAKESENNDDVIRDKQADNRELSDESECISSNTRNHSKANPVDTNDDVLAIHGTPSNRNSTDNSQSSEKREDTLSQSHENRTKPICDECESLLNHTSGQSSGKLVAKDTIVNNNTKYQKNVMGFLRPFKSQKREQGMRNCKSLVFDKVESEELLRDKNMARSYGNLRKPTILAAGNQRRRCFSSCCENENKRYVALRNDFEDLDECPNSPISNSKKTISLSTITVTKLRNNNLKIQRKIDNILTKSWRSLLTVQNSRSSHCSSQDISDGSRGKTFYRNPCGTHSVINVNSNVIYKQPAYSKSWTEISGCMNESSKRSSGHYVSSMCRQGTQTMSPLASSSSDEAVQSPLPRLGKLRELSNSRSSVSGAPRSGSFSEPLKPVNRLRVLSLCEGGMPSKMCSRCSSLLSMAASSKYSVNSLAGFVSVPGAAPEPVAGGSSRDVLCKVCLLEVPHKDSWTLSDCQCTYCLECVLQYVDFEIGQGAYQISCPDAACEKQGLITLAEIQTLVTPEAFEKHKRFRLNKEVDLDKSRTWCPGPGCDTICSLRVGGDRSAPQCVTCITCTLDFCSLCRAPWHDNAPCDKSPLGAATFDSDLIKCCPMCSVPIEKDEGCAQMLCKRCKHVFCWYCLASLDDDFLLRHYDKGPCKNKLGHSRASVIWHRTQVIGIFAGFGILLLVASPLLLLAAPCIVCCKCHVCTSGDSDEDLPLDLPGLEGEATPLNKEEAKAEGGENEVASNSGKVGSASEVHSPK